MTIFASFCDAKHSFPSHQEPTMHNVQRISHSINLVFIILMLSSCSFIWGSLENPADPDSDLYQGFETVTGVNEVEPSASDYGQSIYVPKLTASKVLGGDAYIFEIAADAEFTSPLFTSAEITSNWFAPLGWTDFSSSTIYYWHVKARKNGVWGSWSPPCTFSLAELRFGTLSPAEHAPEQIMLAAATYRESSVGPLSIGKYEVTQEEYSSLLGVNPSTFKANERLPVNGCTPLEAMKYCNALSAYQGLDSVYTISGSTVSANFLLNGYRLPRLYEWLYAANSGNHVNETTYSGSATVDDVAWYSVNSGGTPHPVGLKKPNAFGLYDTSGNVMEYCWDGSNSVFDECGGSWEYDAWMAFSTRCDGGPIWANNSNFGFRVVRNLPASGTISDSVSPTFTWDAIDGAVGYRIQISTNTSFSTLITDDATLTSPIFTQSTPLSAATIYYWRIAGRNSDGLWSVFSVTQSTLTP